MGSGGVSRSRCFPPAFHSAAKPCDYCKSAAALLFCRAESAFMCMSCDSKVHSNISVLKHERVWMCEVCEQAPAAVTCKADAAALCVTCDSDIHCANPLARRHERSAVLPFYDTAESMLLKSSATAASVFPAPMGDSTDKLDNFITQNSYITDSWVSTNPISATKYLENNRFVKPMEFLFSDSDQFLDFDCFQISSQPCSDSVVPVQTIIKPPVTAHIVDYSPEIQFDIDFKKPSITSYNNPSLSSSISSSAMEVGVVPDGSTLSETSHHFARTMSSVDLSGSQGSQVADMDREARVLRYKEKKKNRKFEKTIRYASRKAYAETRPRIKGRFVKRTDSEPDINRFFGSGSGNFIIDARYGVVPSF